MSERPGRYQRSFAGMVGSLIVLLLVIAAFVVFRDVNRNDPAPPTLEVDYAPTAEFAREQAGFPVSAPRRLPDGWIATAARLDSEPVPMWVLGMLTDDEKYVGLKQSPVPVDELVGLNLDDPVEEGEAVVVGDARWRSFTDPDGDLGLARRSDGGSTLVHGRVPLETLETLIGTLR